MKKSAFSVTQLKKVRLKPSPHQAVLHRQIDENLELAKRAHEQVRVINPPLPN